MCHGCNGWNISLHGLNWLEGFTILDGHFSIITSQLWYPARNATWTEIKQWMTVRGFIPVCSDVYDDPTRWYLKNGSWEAAHNIAQDIHTKMGSWIHALLHVIEGDQWNADYWFAKAGKPSHGPKEIDKLWDEFARSCAILTATTLNNDLQNPSNASKTCAASCTMCRSFGRRFL
jgi:hypothetical protein